MDDTNVWINLSKKSSLIFLGLLTILLRYPTTPAPTGTDNFYYLSMVQTILIDGKISWAENLLSFYEIPHVNKKPRI